VTSGHAVPAVPAVVTLLGASNLAIAIRVHHVEVGVEESTEFSRVAQGHGVGSANVKQSAWGQKAAIVDSNVTRFAAKVAILPTDASAIAADRARTREDQELATACRPVEKRGIVLNST
jgi:adenine-specific DNA glycosylase